MQEWDAFYLQACWIHRCFSLDLSKGTGSFLNLHHKHTSVGVFKGWYDLKCYWTFTHWWKCGLFIYQQQTLVLLASHCRSVCVCVWLLFLRVSHADLCQQQHLLESEESRLLGAVLPVHGYRPSTADNEGETAADCPPSANTDAHLTQTSSTESTEQNQWCSLPHDRTQMPTKTTFWSGYEAIGNKYDRGKD